ncbi:MAG: phytanoyl-CoA dioxygenase family protein [Candidatus Poribacteria bacterium]
MAIFTDTDHAFYEENGYVVARGCVAKTKCDAVIDAVWEFLGMDRDDPDDWYREPHSPGGGMVHMHQHQSLWDTRQDPNVHQAFSEIIGSEKLWVSMDRANMKPPKHDDHPKWDHGGFMHWDANTKKLPLGRGVQGVVYLTDTADNQGSFQCIPGEHKHLLDPDNPFVPELREENFRQIPGSAGDLLIWMTALPHGNGRNTSDKPRLAQYITMGRNGQTNEEGRQNRIKHWRERTPGGFPGDPRRIEEDEGTTAELTPLGRKLLGLDLWD